MSRKSSSHVRRLVQQAAQNTTGEVLPRGLPQQDTHSQAERAAAAGISIRTQGKLDYLARSRPDLMEKIKAGTMSVDRAYHQACGVPKKSPLEQVKRLWQKATPEQRRDMAQWVIEAQRKSGTRPIGEEKNG